MYVIIKKIKTVNKTIEKKSVFHKNPNIITKKYWELVRNNKECNITFEIIKIR